MTLDAYFDTVQKMGNLRTPNHAKRWSTATLNTLGLNLDGGTKKKLAKALPEPLSDDLTRVFWLVHFRNKQLPAVEFQKAVARRAGATDAQFARQPVKAVFHGMKSLIDDDTNKAVIESLSPELRELWQSA